MNIMTKRGSLDNIVTYENYCDTYADLANIPKEYATLGSIAVVIEGQSGELEVYMSDSNHNWGLLSTGSSSGGGGDSSGVMDVQVNGNSVVSDGVANIPVANDVNYGVVKVNSNRGIFLHNSGQLSLNYATSNAIKNPTGNLEVLVPYFQHESTFYGLAKAAGDTTQSASSNTVGTYTPEAKTAIKSMLGITGGAADWDENDSSAAGYIENRPFYKEGEDYLIPFDTDTGDTVTQGTSTSTDINVYDFNSFDWESLSQMNLGKIDLITVHAVTTSTGQHFAGFYMKKCTGGTNYQYWFTNSVSLVLPSTTFENTDLSTITLEDTQTLGYIDTANHYFKLLVPASNSNHWFPRAITLGWQIYVDIKGTPSTVHKIPEYYIPDVERYENKVDDVQIDSSSIVVDGVANIPVMDTNTFGVAKIDSRYGISMRDNGVIQTEYASVGYVKLGSDARMPIVPWTQHAAVFYGLAKAAGDSTMASSANAIGTYTESAKSAINSMLNVPETISGSTPTITAKPNISYNCGEVSSLAITIPATGVVNFRFYSGSSATVLTVTPPTGVTIKWPQWFDPTSLMSTCTYEISISDGEYAAVAIWPDPSL